MVDGRILGYAFELWGFLTTYSKVLQLASIPSLEKLIAALKCCDNFSNDLASAASWSPSSSPDYSSTTMTKAEAFEILNTIGMALCIPIAKDYSRYVGFDQPGLAASDFGIPINFLTWREVARSCIITSTFLKFKFNMSEVVYLMRGKGCPTSPDAYDRKLIRLIRRRTVMRYYKLKEGFDDGYHYSARPLPAPTISVSGGADWQSLIRHLASISPLSPWKVYDLIAAAVDLCRRHPASSSPKLTSIRIALQECLSPRVFKLCNATSAKEAALDVLKKALPSAAASLDSVVSKGPSVCADEEFSITSKEEFPRSVYAIWLHRYRKTVRCEYNPPHDIFDEEVEVEGEGDAAIMDQEEDNQVAEVSTNFAADADTAMEFGEEIFSSVVGRDKLESAEAVRQ